MGQQNKSPEFSKNPQSSATNARLWHLVVNYSSLIRITIIDGTPIEATESRLWRVHLWPMKCWNWQRAQSDDVDLNCINQTSSTHLSVVRCALTQLTEKDNWRKSANFHTFTKIGDKSCKVIADSENCINAISFKLCENLRLKIVPHLHSFKVSWIDFTTLRSNNGVLSQSILIIIKTRSDVKWSHECRSSHIR